MAANDKRIIFVILSLCLSSTAAGLNAPQVRWGHQIVTPTKDSIFGTMVADSNDGIYISVSRESENASGATSKACYLLKYNQQGEEMWSKRLGAGGVGDPLNLSVDGLAADHQENIYVFGFTDSKLGQEKKGGYDAFFARYDQAGTRQWVRQVGTPEHDVCTGLDIDSSGNLYVAGYTYGDFAKPNKGQADIFIAAYDQHGTLLWQDQLGTAIDDRASDLRLGDHNDIYICGMTAGPLAGQNNGQADIALARYEQTGKLLWLHQYGTPAEDIAVCMEIGEQGQVYIGGRTLGNWADGKSQKGYGDAFVARIAETGELLWKRQFGTHGWDKTFHMACFQDGSGDLLAGGCQYPTGRYCQAFCRRYSPEGELVWTRIFHKRSPRGGTCGRAVAIDSANNCYHAGPTHADLFGANNGTTNVFIVSFDGMPAKAPAKTKDTSRK